jgi:2-keto-3-deoxy-L-rhamnonate aldolase RhmA
MRSLKSQLRNGEVTIGSWLTLGHPAIAEIMAKAGFDWITVDLEHSSITIDQAEELIRVIDLCQVTPLVRVTNNDPALIKRVMDSGAHGVIVPMINTPAEAERAVAAVRYPPHGTRAIGLARAHGYSLEFERYREWADRENVVIVQIEHSEAIGHLDEILAVPGVDGFSVGQYDLSGSLGIPGQFDHPRFLEALEAIRVASARSTKARGYHVVPPSPQLVLDKIAEGYTFIAYSDDFLFLGETCRRGVEAIRSAHPRRNPTA